jgi:hypothetical protein
MHVNSPYHFILKEKKMSDTITYKLKSPIAVDGGAILEDVTLREPTVDDMIAVDEAEDRGDTMKLVNLLSRICGLSVDNFRKIASRDALAMKRQADAKWGNVEEDGETSPS